MNRILTINSLHDAKRELEKINVSSQGVEVMSPKAIGLSIKLTEVKLGAANILKQEMLSLGGDAAVARGVVNGKLEISDLILLGNLDKIKKLVKKLNYQTIFGLPEINQDLLKFIDRLENPGSRVLNFNGSKLELNETKIIGILNVTPDSFSDGNQYFDTENAVKRALEMISEGSDIIDIGGESTRPGAMKVNAESELERVIPVIKKMRKQSDIPISIDTRKAEVAEKAVQAGASILNDISALQFDADMIKVLQKYPKVPLIMMHMQGTPETMQENPHYEDVIEEILNFFEERINFCEVNGVHKKRIIIDPGIGFGKRQKDNLIILKKIAEFKCLGAPITLGASRKSFIGNIYDSDAAERLAGSLASTALAFQNNIEMIRVHNVREHKNFLKVMKEIRKVK
ncbi:MAG: dihydropteroate synthase [Candidatus Cloacimonetes bacterium]|jgi:dihydropteroate synthase|nr:dihydropteroate synthase [Candidatus Cloacimonadota bacterium]